MKNILEMSEREIQLAEEFQKECHSMVEFIMKESKASYQDATNVYLFSKLAQLKAENEVLQSQIDDLFGELHRL